MALLCTMEAVQLLLPNAFMPEAVRMIRLWRLGRRVRCSEPWLGSC